MIVESLESGDIYTALVAKSDVLRGACNQSAGNTLEASANAETHDFCFKGN